MHYAGALKSFLGERCHCDTLHVDYRYGFPGGATGLVKSDTDCSNVITIAGSGMGRHVAITLARSGNTDAFRQSERDALDDAREHLISLTLKHVILCEQARTLTSLNAIEARIDRTAPRLPRREAQVCARVLYGMTSAGISIDLAIGEESAMTYRKRAYARLGIASQRELLLWYLGEVAPSHSDVSLRGTRVLLQSKSATPSNADAAQYAA